MGSDGANLGILADRALKTILGGAPPPEERELLSPEQMRATLLAAVEPMGATRPNDYGRAACAIGRAMLTIADEAGLQPDMYRAVTTRWPGFDEWLGGATGFMVGWAENAVRYVHSARPVPNPALLQIGPRGGVTGG